MIDNIFRNNIILNNREITEKKSVLDSRPRMLMVVLTNNCNLDCIMCTRTRAGNTSTIPYEQIKKIEPLFPYLQTIDWQGGEVFVVPYFKELFLKAAKHNNIEHSIITNGLLLDEEWTDIIARTRTNVTFSIDSPRKETYEKIRRGGSFEKLLMNLNMVSQANGRLTDKIPLHLNVVVMKSNYLELEEFPVFCRKYGIKHLRFDYLRPDAAPQEDVLLCKNREYIGHFRKVLPSIAGACRESGIWFEYTFGSLLEAMNDDASREEKSGYDDDKTPLPKPKNGCAAAVNPVKCKLPWKKLYIDVCRGGDILPDCLCEKSIGNLYSGDLDSVWNGVEIQKYRNIIAEGNLEGHCSKNCVRNLVDSHHFEGTADILELDSSAQIAGRLPHKSSPYR